MNSPEMIIAWLALLAIGAAPAMINYNLEGPALKHCLNISGAKLMLVDEDEACRQRVQSTKEAIEDDLGIKTAVLDEALKSSIHSLAPEVPDKKYRDGMDPEFPTVLMYTRLVTTT